ncbi:CDP-glycerol glycerophosphotransferase family protein [Lactococcus carnosus]|uniref:CDP-glycerol glycerophosphotransferase family protein n=1 Tax=Pseudolactococcus carnosus TaxID=2749961 RepID=UPI001FBBF34B|nr:CDP-glycerol glycerophosphotransferase family protein [Lactococcus carnosus]MCJ1972901.1 glycosyltransferase [Lactococcus carnosus]
MNLRSQFRKRVSKENRKKMKELLFIQNKKYIVEGITQVSDIVMLSFSDKIRIDDFVLMVDKSTDIISLPYELKDKILSFNYAVLDDIGPGKHRLRLIVNGMAHPIQVDGHIKSEVTLSEDTALYGNVNSNLTAAHKMHEIYLKKHRQAYMREISNNEQARIREYYAYKYDELAIQDNVILYEVRDGTSFTDSPSSIFKYLISNPEFSEFKHVISYDKDSIDSFPQVLDKFPNVKLVERNSFKYLDVLASAKYLFNNSTFHSYFTKKEGQVYVNTWHGTPLKFMGDAYVQDMMNSSNVRRNFLMADYILSPNEFTTNVFLEDYKLNYLWDGQILENGLPRNILSQYRTKNDVIINLKKHGLKIDTSLNTYVYMPTWQGKNVNDASNTIEHYNILIKEIERKRTSDYNLLIKVHPFLYEKVKDDTNLSNYLIPNTYDSNEIFKIVDLLITDYSSVFFDFLVTKKPIIFFNWDADFYCNDRGSYFEEKNLPGPSIKDIETLLSVLNDPMKSQEAFKHNYQEFHDKFVLHEDEEMIEEYVQAIFQNKFDCIKVVSPLHGKKKMLLHAGALMDNGITSSFINLVNQIDKEEYDLTIFLHDSNLEEIKNNWKKLPIHARKMFKPGLPIYKMDENIFDRYLKSEIPRGNTEKLFPEKGYKREVSRLFGNSTFDVSVDFSGYSYFWAKYMVSVDADVKICYMHNDLFAETTREIDGQYPLRNDLLGIFSLYPRFNYLASVSKALMEVNRKKLADFVSPDQMVYIENSININHVINPGKNSSLNTEVREVKQVFLKGERTIFDAFLTLDDLESDKSYKLTCKSDDMIKSLSVIEVNNISYTYISVNGQPMGWVSKTDFGDPKIGIKISSSTVEMSASFKSTNGDLFENIDSIIFNSSTRKSEFIKYLSVRVHSILTIFSSEYYQVEVDNKLYFINSNHFQVIQLNSIEMTGSYLYYPAVTDKFSSYAKFISGNKKIAVYKNKTLVTKRNLEFNLLRFYEIADIQFFKHDYYVKLKSDGIVYGWISIQHIKFDTEYYSQVFTKEEISLAIKGKITFDESKDKFDLKDSKENDQIFSKDKLQTGNYIGKHYTQYGIQHQIEIDNSIYYLSDKNEHFSIWYFKNYRIISSLSLTCTNKEIIYLTRDDLIFVLRKRENKGVKIVDAIYKDFFISFIEDNEFNFSTEHSSDTSHIISKSSFSSFVSLNGNASIWSIPYDRNLNNFRVGATNEFEKMTFQTQNKYVTYLGQIYVDLFFNGEYIGVVNVKKTIVASYESYADEQLIVNDSISKNKVQNTENSSLDILNNESKYYITEKEFSGMLAPKYGEINFFNDEKSVIENVSEFVVLSTNVFASKIVTFSDGHYFYIKYNQVSGLVSAKDVRIMESNYLSDLPLDIKKNIAPEDIVFVTMGRLSPEKNQVALLDATKMIVDKGIDIKVIVLGKGPLEEKLEDIIKTSNLEKNFFLAGQFEYPFELIRQSDFFILPSLWEGQPMVLLEALLLNKKIITSNIATSAHVLNHNKYGLIAPGVDGEALRQAMEKVMTTEQSFARFDGEKYNESAMKQFYDYIKINE